MNSKFARARILGAAGAILLAVAPALAVQPDEMLKDPNLEARARSLSGGFRCMVCQNESIDESNAPLARDLRILIRERLTAGDSDTQIKDFVYTRYGDYVLLKPRLTGQTLLLWLLPFLIVAGGLLFFLKGRKSRETVLEAPLSREEQRRLDGLR